MPLNPDTITAVLRHWSAFASARRPGRERAGASTRRTEDELGDQTSEACPPQDESPPAKVG